VPPLGHLGTHSGGVPREEAWSHWPLDPATLALLAGTGAAYLLVVVTLRRRGVHNAIRSRHLLAFALGWLALAAALLTPLEAGAGEHHQAAHMAQHMLLIALAAPLLAFGMPPARMAALLPRRDRAALARLWRRSRERLPGLVAIGVGALVLHAVVLWLWHLPDPYEAALGSAPLHALEHLTLLATAVVVWWAVLGFGVAVRPGLAPAVILFALAAQGAALGALLTFSSRPWYGPYVESATAAGADPLADQQLAGLLMWGFGGLAPALLAAALVVGWLQRLDRYRPAPG
jgi:putative membrane protein